MNDMKMCALAARPDGWPTDARYSLTIIPHFPDLRRRDLDNLEKTVGDALNGIIWDDDSQIDEVYKRRHLDRENPRVEITITIINPDEGW